MFLLDYVLPPPRACFQVVSITFQFCLHSLAFSLMFSWPPGFVISSYPLFWII